MELPIGAVKVESGICQEGDYVVQGTNEPEMAEGLIGWDIKRCIKSGYLVYRLKTKGGIVISYIKALSKVAIVANTQTARDAKPAPEPAYSDRAKAVFATISNDFGCYRKAVYNLVVAIAGEPLPPLSDEKGKNYPAENTTIVLLKNPNGHDYKIDQPILAIYYNGEYRAMKKDGRIGARIPGNPTAVVNEESAWRYATNEEVDAFFMPDPEEKEEE